MDALPSMQVLSLRQLGAVSDLKRGACCPTMDLVALPTHDEARLTLWRMSGTVARAWDSATAATVDDLIWAPDGVSAASSGPPDFGRSTRRAWPRRTHRASLATHGRVTEPAHTAPSFADGGGDRPAPQAAQGRLLRLAVVRLARQRCAVVELRPSAPRAAACAAAPDARCEQVSRALTLTRLIRPERQARSRRHRRSPLSAT